MNAGESQMGLMSSESVSLAAGFGALLPWVSNGVPFEMRAVWAPVGVRAEDPSDAQRHEFALAALHVSERLVRQLFDDSPISMAVFDPAGRLLHFNHSFGVMLGYAAADLIERNIEEFVHPDDVPAIQERRRMLLEGRCDGFQLETRFAAANRREVRTRMSGRLGRPPGDRPPHIFAHIVELAALAHLQENVHGYDDDIRLKNCDPERYM